MKVPSGPAAYGDILAGRRRADVRRARDLCLDFYTGGLAGVV